MITVSLELEVKGKKEWDAQMDAFSQSIDGPDAKKPINGSSAGFRL
jgi:hypothetical protein